MFLRNVGLLSTDCKALHPRGILFITTAVRTLNPTSIHLFEGFNIHDYCALQLRRKWAFRSSLQSLFETLLAPMYIYNVAIRID
jgi:hypothetical protein